MKKIALSLMTLGLLQSTAALATAVLVGYTRLTVPDRQLNADADEVVRLAAAVSEATAIFSPQDPTSSIDRTAALMAPEQAEALRLRIGYMTQKFS